MLAAQLKVSSRSILHELTTWQVGAALFFRAEFWKEPGKKKYNCKLNPDMKKWSEWSEEELFNVLYYDSDYYRVRKLSKDPIFRNQDMSFYSHACIVVNREWILAIVREFNKKSERGAFINEIPNNPYPRIGPYLSSMRNDFGQNVFRPIITFTDALKERIYWLGKESMASEKQLNATKCGMFLIKDKEHRKAVHDVYTNEVEHHNQLGLRKVIGKANLANKDEAMRIQKELKRSHLDTFNVVQPLPLEELFDENGNHAG